MTVMMAQPRGTAPRLARPARRGVAMLLVLGVIVMGSVLGYAMLSSAAMQKQATTSAAAIAGAQGLAESGVNLAIHYLQNPEKAPGFPTTYATAAQFDRDWGYWRGTNGAYVDFGSPSVGSCRVDVDRPDAANRWKYRITSFGRAPGSTLERKVVATVTVEAEYHVDYAATFTNDARLSTRTMIGDLMGGNVYSNGALSIPTGGRVLGYGVRRRVMASTVFPEGLWRTPSPFPKIVPTFDEIRSYATYEYPAGVVNQATVLTGVTNIGSGFDIQQLGPTSNNPAGVYYVPGNLTLHGGAVIDGTLIVQGSLTIVPAVVGNEIRVRQAQRGFPALVVQGNLTFNALLSVLPTTRVHGLTYVGGRIDTTVPGLLFPTLEITGALLVNGTTPIYPTLGTGMLVVNYNRELAQVPDLSQVGRTPTGIRVKSWKSQ